MAKTSGTPKGSRNKTSGKIHRTGYTGAAGYVENLMELHKLQTALLVHLQMVMRKIRKS